MFAAYSKAKAKDLSPKKSRTTRIGRIKKGNINSRADTYPAPPDPDDLNLTKSPDLDSLTPVQDLGQAWPKNNARSSAAARLKDTLMASARGQPQRKALSKKNNDWHSY